MNEDNFEYLKHKLVNLGFNDNLNAELKSNIANGIEKFTVPASIEFARGELKDTVDFKVDFSKSKETDHYFVNKFEAALKTDDPSKDRSHTFYIDKSNAYTAKEAFNMLEGRAVFKNMKDQKENPYQTWVQLDLGKKNDKGNFESNTYHSNYGFDLVKAIEKHPIKELLNPVHKERLVKSLEKGNLQSVTFKTGDQENKMFIEANPQMKNINVYNENMEKQFQGVKKEKSEAPEQTQEGEKSSKKKEQNQAQEETPSEGKRKRRGISA